MSTSPRSELEHQKACALTDHPSDALVIYQAPDGAVELEVRLEGENLWLSQRQMSSLFAKDTDTIGLHLRNIFEEGELEESATTEDSSVVQQEGKRKVKRTVRFYNLDAILSVGYRVNSKRGTQFRIWATRVLRDHLLQGYTFNQRRLKELNQAVELITETANRRDISGDEAKALLAVVGDYNRALELLDDYDHKRVDRPPARGTVIHTLGYEEALRIVDRLRSTSSKSSVFGVAIDKGLESALGAIMQTAGGAEVYPSLEEKAAQMLYMVVKNHAFVDGNKRIAAALFLWFLERNGALITGNGQAIISNATLVAVTLMIAASRPEEKDVLVHIVTHLLCEDGAT